MKLCKKIAEARKHAGLTQSQLAAAIGVSLVSAQNYEYGKVARIGFDILQKIAVACRVPLDYFLDDQGTSRNIKEHFQPDQPTPTDIPARPTDTNRHSRPTNRHQPTFPPDQPTPSKNRIASVEVVNNNVSIHHYEKARAKAGRISSDAEAPLSFNNEFLRHNFGIKENKNIAIIYAEGNSMEPTIAAGEMLVIGGVDKDEYQDGAIYVVEYNGDMLVKRMQRNPKTGKVRLISDNTSFETIEIEGDDLKNFRIIGRIMMKTIMS